MSMRIDMVPVVDFDEMLTELGKDSIQDFYFYNRADEYDGYFWVNTDEDAILDLEHEIESDIEFCKRINAEPDETFLNTIRNDIALIKLFRDLGHTDGILIYVYN